MSTIKDPSDVVALVVDNGLFVELAVKLSKTFSKVYYHCAPGGAFPQINAALIGDGMDGIELVESIYGSHFEEVDLFVFPDLFYGAEQEHLVECGKAVWGARMGECLELNREGMKEVLNALELPVGEYWVANGVSELRDLLRTHQNVYVKSDKFRGTHETFYAPNYKLARPKLDALALRLGGFQDRMKFIVEASLADKVEIGTDGWIICGEDGCVRPEQTLVGIEVKDSGYIGTVRPFSSIPEPITRFDSAMKPVFEAYGWRGFVSSENRIGSDKEPYMIDLCARAGSPPSELYQELFSNIAECIWFGANGIVVEPEPVAKYGAEIILFSQWLRDGWQPIEIPADVRDSVKLRNSAIIDGMHYIIPQECGAIGVGAAIGMGDSVNEAVSNAIDVADQLRGCCLDWSKSIKSDIDAEIKKLAEYGLDVF